MEFLRESRPERTVSFDSSRALDSTISYYQADRAYLLRTRHSTNTFYARRLWMNLGRRTVAEFLGTFWLVFGGCGSAVIAAAYPGLGVGFVGVAFAFGLTLLTMAYAIGHISGCHLNPAVSVGLFAGGRFEAADLAPYIAAQLVGACAGAGTLYAIASGKYGFDASRGFASNGYGAHSPGGYTLVSCLLAEVVLTAFFLLIILGATDGRAPKGFAPIAIGLGLTLIHLISIPITNTSVNPARSTGPAIFAGGWALRQLWLFWVAPLAGGLLGGGIYRLLFGERVDIAGDASVPRSDRRPRAA
jgi:aquaporin Z